MKKRKKDRAERTRRKRARREGKRNAKGTMTMAEKKIATAAQIRAHMEKKEYAGVINTFADMLAQGNPPEECFGDVARAYFELGDYTRAASWVTNTLSKDASDVDARILLARICQREKRSGDALNVYENILRVHAQVVSPAQRAEIARLAQLDARLDPDGTRAAYPLLAALIGLEAPPAAVVAASAAQTPAAAPLPSVPVTPSALAGQPVAPTASAPAAPVVTAAAPAASPAAEEQAAAILAQDIRPMEKVAALNAFAGAAYAADDHAGARTLLMAALRLDPGADETIRNMALLLHDMGEKEKALQVAAKMRQTDFMLLRTLKS